MLYALYNVYNLPFQMTFWQPASGGRVVTLSSTIIQDQKARFKNGSNLCCGLFSSLKTAFYKLLYLFFIYPIQNCTEKKKIFWRTFKTKE